MGSYDHRCLLLKVTGREVNKVTRSPHLGGSGLCQCPLSRAGEVDDAFAPQATTRPGYSPVFTFLVLFSSERFGVKIGAVYVTAVSHYQANC